MGKGSLLEALSRQASASRGAAALKRVLANVLIPLQHRWAHRGGPPRRLRATRRPGEETHYLSADEAGATYHESFSELLFHRGFAERIEAYTARLNAFLEARPERFELPRVTFLLNRLQRSGGVLSVAQLLNDLVLMGVNAKLVVHSPRGYDARIPLLTPPIFFKNREDLLEHFPESDIVVGTFWNTMYAVAELFLRRENFVPAYFVQDFEADFLPEPDRAMRAWCLRTYTLTPYCFAKTPWLCERVHETGGSITEVPPAVDLDLFRPRGAASSGERKRILAMLRPGTPRRGFDTAMAVFERLAAARDDFEVHSFGSSNEELAGHAMHFPCVNHGPVPNHRLPWLYSQAYCFAEFSEFHGFGRTIAESFACGTPAVVTESGGADSFCTDGVNCLTAKPGDVDALARQLGKLLDEPGFRGQLAAQCRESVRHFNRKRSARETLAFFQSIWGQARGPEDGGERSLSPFYDQLLRNADAVMRAYEGLLASWRWRAGSRAVRLAKRLLRRPVGNPDARLRQVMLRYAAWREHGDADVALEGAAAHTRQMQRLMEETLHRGRALRASPPWRAGALLTLRRGRSGIETHIERFAQAHGAWREEWNRLGRGVNGLDGGSRIELDPERSHVTHFVQATSRNPYYTMIPLELQRRGWQLDFTTDRQRLLERVRHSKGLCEIVHFHQLDPLYHSKTADMEETRRRAQELAAFLQALRSAGAKLVLTQHNPLPHDPGLREVDREIAAQWPGLFDRVVVLGERAREELAPLAGVGKIRVIHHPAYAGYYGPAVPRLAARERLGIEPDRFVFGNLGELKPYKGLEFLIDAFKRMPPRAAGPKPLLILCGNPGDPEFADSLLSRAGDDLTIHAEEVPEHEIPVWLGAMDAEVFAFRSIWASSSVVLATSYGVPAIVPDTGCMPDYVSDGDTGFLYRHGDADDLSAAMSRAQDSSAGAARMRGLCEVRNRRRSVERIATDFEALYGELAVE
ncbi:MAG: glycosyltransferase [Nitrospiraceae bacterium]|nr:glycosyltransferase [Nitrospiraceae bacterium]